MYKIIGADGKEYGPVSVDQLRQWIAEGRANALTRVQPEGRAEWRTVGELPEFADTVGNAPLVMPPLASTMPAEVTARDYHIDIGACLSRGWALVKANMGTLVGGTVLVMLAQMAIGFVPFLGGIISLIIGGALTGGMYWLFICAIRGQSSGVGDAFAGFNRAFVQLMLAQIVVGMLAGVFVAPGAICLAVGIVTHLHHSAVGIGAIVAGSILLLLGIPFAVYFSTCWIFTLPLVIDRQIEFWPAMGLSRQMIRKHWWAVLGLMFVNGLVASAGILACGVGVLFTMPIAIGSMMYAYEDIFGSRPAATA